MADVRLLRIAPGGSVADGVDTDVLKIGSVTAALGLIVGFSGTPTADQVQIGDANFIADFNAGTPRIVFDSGNDDHRYDRTANEHQFRVGGTTILTVTSSVVLFPAGSAAAPGLAFASSTDTGIFSSGAGVLNFTNSGAESARIQGSKNLLLAAKLKTGGIATPASTFENTGSLQLGTVVSPTAFSAQQDNLDVGEHVYIRVTSNAAASRNISGIINGRAGRVLIIDNVQTGGTGSIILLHESASSTAANRITTASGASITLALNDRVVLVYDSTAARWKNVAAAAA